MSAFSWPVRVYWEDTDAAGVVYYASYLRYLERARTEWLRSLGYSQRSLAVGPGIVFAVASLTIDYRLPAKLDDALTVTCEPCRSGRASLTFPQHVYRASAGAAGQELVVEASVRVVCLDARNLRPQRLPEFLALALQ